MLKQNVETRTLKTTKNVHVLTKTLFFFCPHDERERERE